MEEKYFKILISDENIQFRNTLSMRLRLQGFNVECASGGFHLLHVLEKESDFSLVIVHENMMDMPAEEIISLIRTSKSRTELPILFISQSSDDKEIRDMIANGANEFIVKTSSLQPIIDKAKKYFTLLKNT